MLGTYLAESALDSTYTPQIQAKYYKDGQYFDANQNLVSSPYAQPNWLQRTISPTARGIASYNTQMAQSPLDAQMAESNRMYTPTYANTQNQARAYGANGTSGILGTTAANTDINTANYNLNESNAALTRQPTTIATGNQQAVNSLSQSVNNDPMAIRLARNELAGKLGRQPTDLETQAYISGSNRNMAQSEYESSPYNAASNLIGAQGNFASAPNRAGTDYYNSIAANIASRHPSPLGYISNTINPDGSESGPSINPMGISPSIEKLMQMSDMANGQNTDTLPSGMKIQYNKSPQTESATNPTDIIGKTDGSQVGPNDYDPVTGYYGEAANEARDRHNKAVDASHKSTTAGVDSQVAEHQAKIADLKNQKAALESQHARSGLIPLLGRTAMELPGSRLTRYVGSKLPAAGHWLYNNLWDNP